MRNSRHMELGILEYGVNGIEGRLAACIWAVDIDTLMGGESRSMASLMAARLRAFEGKGTGGG